MQPSSDEFDDRPSKRASQQPEWRVVCTWYAMHEGIRDRFCHQSDDYQLAGQAARCFEHHCEIDHGQELVVSLLESDPIGRTKEIRSWCDIEPVPFDRDAIRRLAERLRAP